MSRLLRSVFASWREAGRKIAFFLLLVLGSAAAGAAIAWPLWFFATAARGPYTIFALAAVLVGIAFLLVRGASRARRIPRHGRRPGRASLSALIAVAQAVVFICGLYVGVLLFFHGIWLFAVPLVVIWLGLLILLGMARKATKA
ncbi:MAG TPA: hypothetical protein VMV03_03210 [Spirochaetia bacterium]|nr:hypothetical protein [Spirochaetia bacterium]